MFSVSILVFVILFIRALTISVNQGLLHCILWSILKHSAGTHWSWKSGSKSQYVLRHMGLVPWKVGCIFSRLVETPKCDCNFTPKHCSHLVSMCNLFRAGAGAYCPQSIMRISSTYWDFMCFYWLLGFLGKLWRSACPCWQAGMHIGQAARLRMTATSMLWIWFFTLKILALHFRTCALSYGHNFREVDPEDRTIDFPGVGQRSYAIGYH